MKILNLTKNNATYEQIQDGCFEVSDKQFVDELHKLLSFDDIALPTKQEMVERAKRLVNLAIQHNAKCVMLDNSIPSFLISILENELKQNGIKPFYSFMKHVATETTIRNGSVLSQTIVRKHSAWIEV